MIRGIIAGAFDIIHPGYIYTLRKAKEHCDYLTVALHVDPTVENPSKIKPVLSVAERFEILSAIKYIDAIAFYRTENELSMVVKHYDIKINGDDHTGDEVDWGIPEVFIDRSHGWSTTKLKQLIYEQMREYNDN